MTIMFTAHELLEAMCFAFMHPDPSEVEVDACTVLSYSQRHETALSLKHLRKADHEAGKSS